VALGEGLMVSGFEGFCEAGASWQCVPGLEPWNEERGDHRLEAHNENGPAQGWPIENSMDRNVGSDLSFHRF